MSARRAEREALEDRLREEALKLARLLLPSWDALQQARVWTGLPFLTADLMRGMEAEGEQLRRRQAELQAHPSWNLPPEIAREQAQADAQRLRDHQLALLPLLQACRAHPRFETLRCSGYGTSRYSASFWRMSYYLDAQAAAELCRSTGKADWAALLHDYEQAIEAYGVLEERLRDVRRPAAVHPRHEWDEIAQRLQRLSEQHLDTTRSRLVLAVFKGGELWERLRLTSLPPAIRVQAEAAGLLWDQLEELRQLRAPE